MRRVNAAIEPAARTAVSKALSGASPASHAAAPLSSTVRSSSEAASISRSIRLPVLAVDFQSTRFSGSPGTWGRTPWSSHASRVGSRRRPPRFRTPPAALQGAHEVSSSSRGATVRRRGSPAGRRARTRPSWSSTTAVKAREPVDAPPGRPRSGGHRPLAARSRLIDHDRPDAPERTRGALERDVQSGQPAAAAHAEGELQGVAGDGSLRRDAPVDQEPARTAVHEEPGDDGHGGERERDQVELPGADHARRDVGGGGDREQGDSPCGRPRHRPGPGTGTASRMRAITASSACACAPASADRMMRWLSTRTARSLTSCGTT